LKEFESLAAVCEQLASNSKATDQQLLTLSDHTSTQIAKISARQNALEERLETVTAALNRQTASTNALIESVNTLIGRGEVAYMRQAKESGQDDLEA